MITQEHHHSDNSGDEPDMSLPSGEITLSLREHNIAFSLPFGARMEGKLLLPCGALIYGDFIGDIFCESGSVIIKRGANFRGMVEADRIYVEGEITAVDDRRRSVLIARQMLAGSSTAKINADIFSQTFALHKAKLWGTMRTLEESEPYRKSNKALANRPAVTHTGASARPKTAANASSNAVAVNR